jgi:hypothetical protein
MKQITTILFVIFLTVLLPEKLFSQTADSTQYMYCELVGYQKFLSTKMTMIVDFGETMNYWKDNRVRDEESGKVKTFNSMVDGLNYMGKNGWEFVQAYVVTIQSQNVYHWLLKKRK